MAGYTSVMSKKGGELVEYAKSASIVDKGRVLFKNCNS
jgi:hypothetical protein